MSESIRLVIALAYGDTIRQWEEKGLFDRELAYLSELQQQGAAIDIVSYGSRDEYEFRARLPGMRILCNWPGFSAKTYRRHLHQLHAPQLVKAQVARTWNSPSLVEASRIAWAWGLPMVYRTDFLLSELRRNTFPDDVDTIEKLEGMESKGLRDAARIIAPSQALADSMARMAPESAVKVNIIPNFVDTEVFQPLSLEKRYDLVYVGRLSVVKNLWALLEAVEKLDVNIAIIGGPLEREVGTTYDESIKLKDRFGDLDGRIHWIGRVKNEDLPAYLNRAKCLILCSHSEGHPRSLLEAMACGLPCIGSNIVSIRSILEHEVSGYLCETGAESIAEAIKAVLAQPRLMQRMGENARRFSLEHYSLPKLARREFEILADVARRNPLPNAGKRLLNYVFRRR